MMRRLELKLLCADLITQDRSATGRYVGHVGEMRVTYEAGMRALLASLKHINSVIDALYGSDK